MSQLRHCDTAFFYLTIMPFQSQAQWFWAFATGQPFARRWAHETPGGKKKRFQQLPTKVATKAQTPEEKAIFAKLGGSGGGGSGGGGSKLWSKGPSGKRQPTRAQAEQHLDHLIAGANAKIAHTKANVTQTQNDYKASVRRLNAAKEGTAEESRALQHNTSARKKYEKAQAQHKRAVEEQQSLYDRGLRPYNIQTKGYDAKAGQQIQGRLYRGNDGKFHAGGSADDQAKATIAQNKKLNAAAPRGKGKGKGKKAGGKGAKPKKVKVAKPKLTPEQRKAEKLAKQQANRDAVKKAMDDAQEGLAPNEFDALVDLAAKKPLDAASKQALVDTGMASYRRDGSVALTTHGHEALRASSAGDTKAAITAVQQGMMSMAPGRGMTKSVRIKHQSTTRDMPVLSATTYKSIDGQRRWLFVSSTAYQDRDGEIVTTKALRRAVELADQTGYRGNLRYWHLPSHLGDCDWQMVSDDGTLLYESGSFASDAIADWYEANKEQYVLSIGFRHPVSEPLPDKSFDNIFIFERSLLPVTHTSNVFTGKVQ